jgi:serine/threonine protein kinase
VNYCEDLDLRELPESFQVVDAPWATTWRVDTNGGLVLNAGMEKALEEHVGGLLGLSLCTMEQSGSNLIGRGAFGSVYRSDDLAFKYRRHIGRLQLDTIWEMLIISTIGDHLRTFPQVASGYNIQAPQYYGASWGSMVMDYIPGQTLMQSYTDDPNFKFRLTEVRGLIKNTLRNLESFRSPLGDINPFSRDHFGGKFFLDIEHRNLMINGLGIYVIDSISAMDVTQ